MNDSSASPAGLRPANRRVGGRDLPFPVFLAGFCLAAVLLQCVLGAAPAGRAPAAPGGPILAESERVYLAEIEHRGLVLGRKGFPAIQEAIKSGDRSRLTRFFAKDFSGQTLDLARGANLDTEVVKVRRITNATNAPAPPVPVDGASLADFLQGLWRQLRPSAQTEMALMSFSPLRREQLDGAWRGTCLLRFTGPRAAGGHAEILMTLQFELATVPDVEDIATTPGWIRSLRVASLQEALATRELLAEVAKGRGIDPALFQDNWNIPDTTKRIVVTGGVFLADVDDDGYEDVLVTDALGVFLFRGLEGGRFEEVTTRYGLPRAVKQVANAAFADFDNDGRVDLLLDHRVFRNVEGRRFEELTEKIAAKTQFRFGATTLGLSVGDYDRDGRIDIYVSRSNGPKGTRYGKNSWIDGPGGPGNQLWRNLGDWKFEDVSDAANARAGRRSVFTSAWLDANLDQWPDIYVINEFGGGVLLLNQTNGTFKEQSLIDDVGDFGSMGMAVGDYDNDGHIDIYTCNMSSKSGRRVFENLSTGTYPPDVWAKIKRFVTGSEMYRNLGGLKFQRTGQALRVHGVGWAYGGAFFDLDNDGWQDLYGTAGFMSVNKEEPDG